MADDAIVAMVKEVASVLGAMTGVKQAPNYPPESANDPPMVIVKHVWTRGNPSLSFVKTISHIEAVILFARSMLPHEEEQVLPYVYLGVEAISGAVTLNAKASALTEDGILCEGPRAEEYGGQIYYGIRYSFDYKILNTGITVAT